MIGFEELCFLPKSRVYNTQMLLNSPQQINNHGALYTICPKTQMTPQRSEQTKRTIVQEKT